MSCRWLNRDPVDKAIWELQRELPKILFVLAGIGASNVGEEITRRIEEQRRRLQSGEFANPG
jgi:hypothetical protein